MFCPHATFLFLIVKLLLYEASGFHGRGTSPGFKEEAIIFIRNVNDTKFLKELEKERMIHVRNEVLYDQQYVLIQVDSKNVKKLRKLLRERGMNSAELTEDVRRILTYNHPNDGRLFQLSNYDFGNYHTFKNIVAFLKHLTKKYRDISRLMKIGKSYEKRPLYAVKISSKPTRKKIMKGKQRNARLEHGSRSDNNSRKMIMMDCGAHAREWASIAFCTYFINKLITGYKEDYYITSVVEKYDFMIIPVLNPDGYVYSQTHDRLWRKNRSKNEVSPACYGVDINRNFNFASSSDMFKDGPCSPIYKGPRPFSEPATASLNRLLHRTKGSLKAYFSIHAFSQLWLLPWAKCKEHPRDFEEMKRVAEIGVKAIAKLFGTKFKVGSAADLLYVTEGTLLDYIYENGFARYSFSLELRDTGQYGFLLPANQILPMCQETTAGVLAAVMALK